MRNFHEEFGPGPRAGRGGHGRFGGRRDWGPGDMPWRGGRRMRRGDIRTALLIGLLDGPAHGYELIGRLEDRSGGLWRPSAGSVYPTLQMLEEEGLVAGRDESGKRVYQLTDEGRTHAESAPAQGPFGPTGPETAGHRGLWQSVRTFTLAARQVALAGDEAQVQAAQTIVNEARQKLYRLLAGE